MEDAMGFDGFTVIAGCGEELDEQTLVRLARTRKDAQRAREQYARGKRKPRSTVSVRKRVWKKFLPVCEEAGLSGSAVVEAVMTLLLRGEPPTMENILAAVERQPRTNQHDPKAYEAYYRWVDGNDSAETP